ncbi:MAG TPA: transketolase C-terminal domain-containing protein, partial [Gammaproteobacteria bacterium]|nr:transketolase C-terminal domain-containing protein [Gammaproteobacteria bacterium]
LDAIYPLLPEMLGGSADLSESNLTHCKFSKAITPHQFDGNYIYYGVREFGMSAIMNGIALYGGFIPYGGTFLTFLDYARNAVRLSALMGIRVVFVYTHDSVGLGEDGPTHQPIEHLTILRATPNMSIWRPCDATETSVAWAMALQRSTGPTSLILSRQMVPHQVKTPEQVHNIARGGYILVDCEDAPIDAILISTGSEVSLAVLAAKQLQTEGFNIRVVSMPSTDVFQLQEVAYRDAVLPPTVKKRVAIEAASTNYWYSWVGQEGAVVGIDRFGESAPGATVFEALGLTIDAVILKVKQIL